MSCSGSMRAANQAGTGLSLPAIGADGVWFWPPIGTMVTATWRRASISLASVWARNIMFASAKRLGSPAVIEALANSKAERISSSTASLALNTRMLATAAHNETETSNDTARMSARERDPAPADI